MLDSHKKKERPVSPHFVVYKKYSVNCLFRKDVICAKLTQ